MACIVRRFFGLQIVEDAPPDLAETWGKHRNEPGILIFAGRGLLWRLAFSRSIGIGLADKRAAVVPTGRAARRHVRLACGCDTGLFSSFRDAVRVLSRAESDKAAVFLVDTTPAAVRHVEENVRATFPDLRIVGRAVFSPAIVASITTAIRKSEPRIVLVGSARTSVLSWAISHYDVGGDALVLVAQDAVARMAGRTASVTPGSVLLTPFWILLYPALAIHRLVLLHRRKRSKA